MTGTTSKYRGPDFSHINSAAKVQELVELGVLEPLYLMPLEFGGPETPMNCVFVPIGISDLKQSTDLNIIASLIERGVVTRYSAAPQYQGDSFVPTSIEIKATDPGNFESCIQIWGETE